MWLKIWVETQNMGALGCKHVQYVDLKVTCESIFISHLTQDNILNTTQFLITNIVSLWIGEAHRNCNYRSYIEPFHPLKVDRLWGHRPISS